MFNYSVGKKVFAVCATIMYSHIGENFLANLTFAAQCILQDFGIRFEFIDPKISRVSSFKKLGQFLYFYSGICWIRYL